MKNQQENDNIEKQNLPVIPLIKLEPIKFELTIELKLLEPIKFEPIKLSFEKSSLTLDLALIEVGLPRTITEEVIYQGDRNYSYIDQYGILHEPRITLLPNPDLYRFKVMEKVLNKVASDNYTIGYKDALDFRIYDKVGSLETASEVVEKYKKIAEQQKLKHFLELAGICKNGTLNESLGPDQEKSIISFLKLTDITHEVSSTPNIDNGDNEVSALGSVSDYNHDNCEQV